MNRLVKTAFAALLLASPAGCVQEPLPSAPPPIRDAYSDPAGPQAPKAVSSKGDAVRRYSVEAGASAEEH